MQSVKSKLPETTRQRNFFNNSNITSSIITKVGEKGNGWGPMYQKKNWELINHLQRMLLMQSQKILLKFFKRQSENLNSGYLIILRNYSFLKVIMSYGLFLFLLIISYVIEIYTELLTDEMKLSLRFALV